MSYSSVSETPKNSLISLIQEYLDTTELSIQASLSTHGDSSNQWQVRAKDLRVQADYWYEQSWLEEKASNRDIALAMRQLGYDLVKGRWLPMGS